jgi:hypothetical protein
VRVRATIFSKETQMKNQIRLNRTILCLVTVLVSGLTPMVSSAECIAESSGTLQWEFNATPVGETSPFFAVNGVLLVFDPEGNEACPHSTLSGSLVENTSEEEFDIGATAHFTGCAPIVMLAATVDTTLKGTGEVLIYSVEDKAFTPFKVKLASCDEVSERSTQTAPEAKAWLFRLTQPEQPR